ncbi:hypothetical protein P7C70_g9638, partial [Phenoliferia sp. Uapishka_3]
MPPHPNSFAALQEFAIRTREGALGLLACADSLEDEAEAMDLDEGAEREEVEDEVEELRLTASALMGISVVIEQDVDEAKARGKRGPRGPYRVRKSRDSLPILIKATDRYFRKNFR